MTDEERQRLREKLLQGMNDEELIHMRDSMVQNIRKPKHKSIFQVIMFVLFSLILVGVIGVVVVKVTPEKNFRAVYANCPYDVEAYDELAHKLNVIATISDDGSILTVDTNPQDVIKWSERDDESAINITATAGLIIQYVHEQLGVPEYVWEMMMNTTSIDGVQTYEGDGFIILWTYHPEEGLEVLYEVNKDSRR